MKKQILSTLAISAALAFLSGCAKYNATSLNTLSSEAQISSWSETKDVLVAARAFNKAECKRYLDRDVLARGYQPVQLYIENNSDRNYIFSLNRVSLSVARPEEVAKKVHTSTVGRAVGYGAGALIFWPLAIPAVVDGVNSSQANEALDNDFLAKAARNQVIQSHSNFNKLLFIPVSEYQPTFYITLIDEKSHEMKKIRIVLG